MPSSGGSVSDAPVNKVVDGQDHQLSYIAYQNHHLLLHAILLHYQQQHHIVHLNVIYFRPETLSINRVHFN